MGYYTATKTQPGDPDDWSAVASKDDWLALDGHGGLTATYSQCRPQAGGVDRAFCWNTFTLPPNIAPGFYGVMWWWEFNGGEHYNSCAGLRIVATEAELTSPPAPPPPPAAPAPSPGDPAPVPNFPPGSGVNNGNCPGQNNPAPDCTTDHECCDPGEACYRKNRFYSGCRPAGTCTPGALFDGDANTPFHTPWDCTCNGGQCNAQEQTMVNAANAAGQPVGTEAEGDLYLATYGDSAAAAMNKAMEEAAAGAMPMPPMAPTAPVPGAPTAPGVAPATPVAPGAPVAGVSSASKFAGTSLVAVTAMMSLC